MRLAAAKVNARPLPAAGLPAHVVVVLDALLGAGVLDGEDVDSLTTVELHALARSWVRAVSAGEPFDARAAVHAAQSYERRAA